ncbi:hypothetical protein E4N71_10680 [Treponema vincentii]|nr:hypothetical protein E4N66_05525 [Treponema sp. OMZ 857]
MRQMCQWKAAEIHGTQFLPNTANNSYWTIPAEKPERSQQQTRYSAG